LLAHRRHEYDRATQLLSEASATFRVIGERWNLGVALHLLGDTARERERWTEAIPIYQESLTSHWEERDVLGVADALLRLAQILVALGEMDTAVRLFGCAEAQHEQAGVLVRGIVRTSYEQTIDTALTALGAEQFAATWQAGRDLVLEEAVALAMAICLPELAGSQSMPHSERVVTSPALSARERDVLRLLVDGQSDREISETLSIGIRTVHTHVANILNKLGVSSRTAAATRAVREGLV
jgi:DNA-binding NarL/FixJ family response regulator